MKLLKTTRGTNSRQEKVHRSVATHWRNRWHALGPLRGIASLAKWRTPLPWAGGGIHDTLMCWLSGGEQVGWNTAPARTSSNPSQ